LESRFKVTIVWLILDGKVERALKMLAEHYGTSVPTLKVGLPKGRKRTAAGCYNARTRTIQVLDSDALKNPFVILHEFYHHLRTTVNAKHLGTEKYANQFAKEYIQAFKTATAAVSGND